MMSSSKLEREENITKETHQWCMYFWIPQGMKMKKGKLAGQVAHAAARLSRYMTKEQWEDYIEYEVKIVYKVADFDALFRIQEEMVRDHFVMYHTMVFDNTSQNYTVFGVATKTKLHNSKWRLA